MQIGWRKIGILGLIMGGFFIFGGNSFALEVNPEELYTQNYPFIFWHNNGDFSTGNDPQNKFPYSEETLKYLAKFNLHIIGGSSPIPSNWVDYLHTASGLHRTLLGYEYFGGFHFAFGYDRASNVERWAKEFLDKHLYDYYFINPLDPTTGYTKFEPGTLANPPDSSQLFTYLANYAEAGLRDELSNEYYYKWRRERNYDGVFLDLAGSYFTKQTWIRDPADHNNYINTIQQYDYINQSRGNYDSYDVAGGKFLQALRARDSVWPISTNQAFRSSTDNGHNEYYRVIDFDVEESLATTWFNAEGTKRGKSVYLNGRWYYNQTIIETKIIPWDDILAKFQPMAKVAEHAKNNFGRIVPSYIIDYVRPYYNFYGDGYFPSIDRNAIYYSYAVGKTLDILSYASDYFDTILSPISTQEPPGYVQSPYFTYAKDNIYFLDLGEPAINGYKVVGNGSMRAIIKYFTKGFVVLNASNPIGNVSVDITDPSLKDALDGVAYYYDHYSQTLQDSQEKIVMVPAMYYPLENCFKNSARVFSYLDMNRKLIGSQQNNDNRPPIAQISATPQTGVAPLTVQFSAFGSSEPDGDTMIYLWNFGDGIITNTVGDRPSHTYNNAGGYNVTLTVSDDKGASSSASVTITVKSAPTPTPTPSPTPSPSPSPTPTPTPPPGPGEVILQGTVRDTGGNPIGMVRLTLRYKNETGRYLYKRIRSDTQGRYSLSFYIDSRQKVKIRVYRWGYRSVREYLIVEPSKTVEKNFILQRR